jgi:hypothetical protein
MHPPRCSLAAMAVALFGGVVVAAAQRFTNDRRCPICTGSDRDPRGTGKRCSGFISSDGKYAHCSREEHAGTLPREEADTYAHRLSGPCKCGATHGELAERTIEATYDYRDESGRPVFQVVRFIGKTFKQRKPDGVGGWIWKLEGVRRVLYRLPELLAADPAAVVYICEGEKDVETLRARGFAATTSSQGAKNWRHTADNAVKVLRGRHVVIVPDNDEEGRLYASTVAASLIGVAASVRTCRLPAKDVSDWFAAGHTIEEFADIVSSGLDDETKFSPQDENGGENPWTALLAKSLAEVKALLATETPTDRKPMGIDAVDLLAQNFDGARALIQGLVPATGTTVFGGEPKSIKTWSATECAIAVATGTAAFGEFYAEHGIAMYIYAEDSGVSVKSRVRALLKGSGRTLAAGRLILQPRGAFLDVLRDEDVAWIVASARQHGKVTVLFIDPLRDIHSGEEDKSDSMRNVMRRLRVIADLIGCAVVFVHHKAKATKDNAKRRVGQDLRGSGAIHGAVDAVLSLEVCGGDEVGTFVNSVKSQIRDGRSAGQFQLELRIQDDSDGHAERAEWTFTREAAPASKKAAAEALDDNAIEFFVRDLARRGEFLTRTKLREHDERPIPDHRTRDSLDRLIEKGRLVLRDGRVRIPDSKGRPND